MLNIVSNYFLVIKGTSDHILNGNKLIFNDRY